MTAARVLVVHSSDELYGADRVLLLLAAELPRADFRLTVVVPAEAGFHGSLRRELGALGVEVLAMPLAVLRRRYFGPVGIARFGALLVTSTWRLRRLAAEHDLVHSFTTAVVPGALAAKLARRPHVWSAHELVTEPRWLWRLTSWLLPAMSRRVVAVSTAMRDHLVAGSARNEPVIRVVPNAVAPRPPAPEGVAALREELGLDGGVVLVSVGRLRPGKGQEDLLHALPAILAAHPGTRLVLAGEPAPGEEPYTGELAGLARRLGVADQVTFAGFRSDVPELLAVADVVVQPSRHPESFGLGLLEAMLAGTAVVATGVGATPEVLGDAGVTVPPCQPVALAGAVGSLLGDPGARAALAAAARERALARFGAEAFSAGWAAVYREALDDA